MESPVFRAFARPRFCQIDFAAGTNSGARAYCPGQLARLPVGMAASNWKNYQ
jgi:hypothetical protein